MNRKSLFLVSCICLLLFPLMTRATGLQADIVVIDGEKWSFLASPLNGDDSIYKRVDEFLPKGRCWSTANWEGFTGCWEIVDGNLYLKKIVVDMWDEHKREEYELEFDAASLKPILKEY